jgi:hypothetical protein
VAVLYLDNDVSQRLWPLLRADGHLVTLTKDRHSSPAPDELQLVTALELNANLVTHNNYRDFALLHGAWTLWTRRWRIAEAHPPILVLPQGHERQLRQYLEELLQVGSPASNSLYRYRPSSGWSVVP